MVMFPQEIEKLKLEPNKLYYCSISNLVQTGQHFINEAMEAEFHIIYASDFDYLVEVEKDGSTLVNAKTKENIIRSFYPQRPSKHHFKQLREGYFFIPNEWIDNMKYLSEVAILILLPIAKAQFSKRVRPRPITIEEIYESSNKNEVTIDSIKKACQELIDKKFIYPEMVKF